MLEIRTTIGEWRVNLGRSVIDPRRVFGSSSRHEVAIISERWKTVHEIRHRKNIAIDMLLVIRKILQEENCFILLSYDLYKGRYVRSS